jgi:hypothetical protein
MLKEVIAFSNGHGRESSGVMLNGDAELPGAMP